MVSCPRWFVAIIRLIAPSDPPSAIATREQLQIRPRAARLDQRVLLVRLSGVLALAGGEEVHLGAAGGEGAGVLSADAEQDHLRDVAEVEADAAAVGAAVLPDLVPDEVGLVAEAPGSHDRQPLGQERIGDPQVEVGDVGGDPLHRQGADVLCA